MPSATRYARAAAARRSPRARLYSAVPRSSQWPSTVTAQLAYFLSKPAFSSRTLWLVGPRSLLSSSKNTGFSGELRLRSSSDADEIESSGTGSGGTIVGSRTGSGGVGRGFDAGCVVAGGGIGRATGGGFFLHPA